LKVPLELWRPESDVANAEKHLTEREVDKRVEAILNAKVMPDMASLKRDMQEVRDTLRAFIGDGNGGGLYGRNEAAKHEELKTIKADVADLKTEKTQRDAVAKDQTRREGRLDRDTAGRDRRSNLYIALGGLGLAVGMAILGLLTYLALINHGQHQGLRTSTPVVTASYDSSIPPR
jgi:hypothetical protein